MQAKLQSILVEVDRVNRDFEKFRVDLDTVRFYFTQQFSELVTALIGIGEVFRNKIEPLALPDGSESKTLRFEFKIGGHHYGKNFRQ